MKTVFAALGGAVGTTLACWRLILILWLVVASAAWLFATPLRTELTETYARSPMATGLLQTFDNESFVDFWSAESDPVGKTSSLIQANILGWIVLWTILSAGILVRVADKQRFDGLLSSCARYAHRFVWLLVMSLLAWWVLGWLNDHVSTLVTALIQGADNSSGAGFLGWTMTIKTLFMLALFGLVLTAGRFARLRVVLLEERFVVLSWFKAFGAVVRHLPSIGLGRVLSLWPIVLAFLVYRWGTEAVMSGWQLIPGLRMEWHLVLVMQLSQVLLIAALVYRMAVDARLWIIVAPRVELGQPVPAVAAVAAAPVATAKAAPTAPAAEATTTSPVAAASASDVATPKAVAPKPETPTPQPVPASTDTSGPSSERPPTADTPSSMPTDVTTVSVSKPASASAPATAPALPKDGLTTPPPREDPPASSGGTRTGFMALFFTCAIAGALHAQEADDTAPATPAAVAPAQVATDTTAAARSTQQGAYVMDVTLDILGRTISGIQHATFINTSSKPVNELWMHLYASAFSNTHTSWMQGNKEDAIRERGEALGGYMNVRSVALSTGGDLSAKAEINDTLMRVPLDRAVPPGGSVQLLIEFETRFPDVIARMGQVGRHVDGMQWFPKYCAHSEDGWSKRPFHRTGEFFADFGSYDVTFHYPESIDEERVVLEATGEPGPEEPDGAGWVRRRFTAQDVHDFAFCADTAFVRYEATYEDPETGRTVDIVYLCQPYAEPKAEQVLSVMKSSLRAASDWWMAYPYPRIVIDGLPHSQGGGMEYPMLFTISQRFPNHLQWLVDLTEAPAHVTAHEFGHQYWYGILASDEVSEAWLDEGINTWGTIKLLEAHWPDAGQTDFLTFLDRKLVREALNGGIEGTLPFTTSDMSLQSVIGWRTSPFHDTPPAKPAKRATLLGYNVPDIQDLRLPDMSANRPAWWKSSYRPVADARPLTAPSREFSTGYGGLVYRKTALVLQTLERHVGTETMSDIMKTYVERFAFSHPTGEDFLQVVSELTDGKHDSLLRQFIESSGTVDWTVEEVKTTRIGEPEGFALQRHPGDPVTWQAPENAHAEDSEEDRPMFHGLWSYFFSAPYPGSSSAAASGTEDAPALATETTSGNSDEWLSRYVVRQLGDIEAPVEVEARFADGSTIRRTWDGVDGYGSFEHRTPSKLTSVVVDPDRLFIIDLDVNNNGRVLEANHETTRALAAYSHFWTQNVLAGWSLIF